MVDTVPTRADAHPSATRRPRVGITRTRAFAPLAIGASGLLFTGFLAWNSSLWYDEAATVSATTRTVPQLLALLQNVDAVHGLYYLVMHFWFATVGYSPFTLRMPSTIATAVAAGLLVVLARRLVPERTAIVAGVVFLLLPRVTWMATEGRSYAMTVLIAVALTLVFMVALDWSNRDRAQRILIWVAYGLLAILAGALFIYLALLVAAHGVIAVVFAISRRRDGAPGGAPGPLRGRFRGVLGWMLASAGAAAALIPLLRLAASQTKQISWLDPLDPFIAYGVFVNQWSLGNWAFAIAAWIAVLIAIVSVVRKIRARVAESRWHPGPLLVITLAWMFVPTLALLAATAFVTPLYSSRYVTFAAPAFAILVAVGLTVLPLPARPARAFLAFGLVVLLAFTLPSYTRQRSESGKQYTAWSQLATTLASQRAAEPSGQTDAVIYGPLRMHPDADMAMLALAYPQQFAGLIDLKAGESAADRASLWSAQIPLTETHSRLGDAPVIWLVTSDKRDWRPSVTTKLANWGYRYDTEWSFPGTNLVRYVRS